MADSKVIKSRIKEYYTVSNDTSSVYYGELNGTYKEKGMNNGVVAELTEGATLTVSEPLNVYAAKKVDLFTFNLVRMDCDVNYLSIRLTDCYDPNIEFGCCCARSDVLFRNLRLERLSGAEK